MRKVVLSFTSYGKQEIALINEYLENQFIVIATVREAAEKEYLVNQYQFASSGNLYIFECDFADKYAAQEFQQILFKSFYPIDVLVSDFGNTSSFVLDSEFPIKNRDELVNLKLSPFVNLLKCLFPMMSSRSSFFIECFSRTYLHRIDLKELKRMADQRKKVLLDQLLEDNSNTKIVHQKINLSLDRSSTIKLEF